MPREDNDIKMLISFATANLYYIPFEKVLDIIKKAGYEYIELDDYWKGSNGWETAQHLKGYSIDNILSLVDNSGLKIASYHDMGGVLINIIQMLSLKELMNF